MDKTAMEKLEYQRIKDEIAQYTLSYLGQHHVEKMEPLTDVVTVKRLQEEVKEAVYAVRSGSSVPIPTMEGIQPALSHIDKGMTLTAVDVLAVSRFLRSTEQLQQFMRRKTEQAPNVASYALSLNRLSDVRVELDRCVSNGSVTDEASSGLAKVRKKLRIVADRLKKKLDGTMRKYRSYLQDEILTERGGRTVLSVQRAHKRMVPGVIVDQSSSGQTLFIEPADIVPLQQELLEFRSLEEMEVSFVLEGLTHLVQSNRSAIDLNIEVIGQYDFLFAKAKFAKSLDGRTVRLNARGRIDIKGGKHPLLGNDAVPLDFSIGEEFSVLVITGPNTGGKTVSLKTVGLLTLMVQSGLLVPVGEGSEFAVFDKVLADIGDGQSIDESLSTFSAHVKNVIDVLRQAGNRTLVLMDELAAGTDPGEGIGLSISVLEALYQRGATLVATTHFNEIKEFAKQAQGFQNARMEFDIDTLQPLYKLKIGEAGNSYAFEIALKLGMPTDIIEKSRRITQQSANTSTAFAQRAPKGRPDSGTGDAGTGKADRQDAGTKAAGSADGGGESSRSDKKSLQAGDRVWIHTLKKSGIVYNLPDDRGNMTVVVQQKRMTINRKRVSPYLSREQLYPENYDLDVVLESKDDRRKRKQMSKRHVEGLVIHHAKDAKGPKLDRKDRWI